MVLFLQLPPGVNREAQAPSHAWVTRSPNSGSSTAQGTVRRQQGRRCQHWLGPCIMAGAPAISDFMRVPAEVLQVQGRAWVPQAGRVSSVLQENLAVSPDSPSEQGGRGGSVAAPGSDSAQGQRGAAEKPESSTLWFHARSSVTLVLEPREGESRPHRELSSKRLQPSGRRGRGGGGLGGSH